MSIAAAAVGEMAIGAESSTPPAGGKPPPRRKVTAKSDATLQPEAR